MSASPATKGYTKAEKESGKGEQVFMQLTFPLMAVLESRLADGGIKALKIIDSKDNILTSSIQNGEETLEITALCNWLNEQKHILSRTIIYTEEQARIAEKKLLEANEKIIFLEGLLLDSVTNEKEAVAGNAPQQPQVGKATSGAKAGEKPLVSSPQVTRQSTKK